ncbi:MAG: tetratricopeptide repeat protein [Gemmatimonadota bacterium]
MTALRAPARAAALAGLALLVSCAGPPAAPATGDRAWEATFQRAAQLLEEGRTGDAAEQYAAALQQVPAGDGHSEARLQALEGLARARIMTGELGRAESLYVEVLAILADSLRAVEVPGERLVSTLGTLADLNQSLGRPQRSEAYYRRILELSEGGWVELGPTDLALAYTLAGMARLRRARGDSTAADLLAGRAMGVNLLSQAHDLYIHDRLDEAEPLLRRALALQERFLGPGHGDLAETCLLLGRLLEATGHGDEALAQYRRAAAIGAELAGRAGGIEAAALEDLAALLRQQGTSDEADRAASRALQIRRGLRGGEGGRAEAPADL